MTTVANDGYIPKPYESFGEWLHNNRIAAKISMRRMVLATGKSRPTLIAMEADRTPPEKRAKRIPRHLIDTICEVFAGANKEEALFLGGWAVKPPPRSNGHAGDLAAIATIAADALAQIQAICRHHEIVILNVSTVS